MESAHGLGSTADDPGPPCAASAPAELLPGLIGPVAGEEPVWLLTDGGADGVVRSGGPDCAVKALWVVSRAAAVRERGELGDALRVVGWRLGESGDARAGSDAPGDGGHIGGSGHRPRKPGRDPELAAFRRGAEPVADHLVIEAAALDRGVMPGGATREVLERYAFWPSYVLFPAPGCWELEASLGGARVRIVKRVVATTRAGCDAGGSP